MANKKASIFILMAFLSVMTGACGAGPEDSSSQTASGSVSSTPSETSTSSLKSTGESGTPSQAEKVLYIGMGDSWAEVPRAFSSEPSPEELIQAVSEETGWNLTLAEPVAISPSEEGKPISLTVVFSKESALWIGPPEPQNEKYFVFDSEDLDFHILDSVQKTLRENLINPAEDDALTPEITFGSEDGQPLSLPGLDIEIPTDSPYPGSSELTRLRQ